MPHPFDDIGHEVCDAEGIRDEFDEFLEAHRGRLGSAKMGFRPLGRANQRLPSRPLDGAFEALP